MDLGGLSTSTSKWCPKCQEVTERGKPAKAKLIGRCIICNRNRNKLYAQKNRDKIKENARKLREKNLEKFSQYQVKYRLKHPEKVKARMANWYKNNKHKADAHAKVKRAVAEGELPKPNTQICIDCGCNATEYHHEDYTKPLEVLALCRPCHQKRHRVNSSMQHPTD